MIEIKSSREIKRQENLKDHVGPRPYFETLVENKELDNGDLVFTFKVENESNQIQYASSIPEEFLRILRDIRVSDQEIQ